MGIAANSVLTPEELMRNGKRALAWALLLACLAIVAPAKDVTISIPKHTKPTPVQKLNQEGVKEIEKHNYKKAKALFYKAYLIDPDDPFTLNNLGYIAEIEGQADRAERFYTLAQEQGSDAIVYKSTERAAIGKPVDEIAGNAADTKMQINRINVYAIGLLRKGHAPEADLALQEALKLDPNDPFTLNNLGYAREQEGELEQAYAFYTRAANEHSDSPIIVTMHTSWRGKPISEIAGRNADKVRDLMDHEQSVTAKVARLNTRGVAAINRNDDALARQYFQEAYKLDPKNAFALNNMGYLAELDGDRETADYYYGKAREADQSSMKVAYASRKDVEGMKLGSVAGDSDQAVEKATEEAAELRREEGGPVVLRYRNDQPVVEPATPPKPQPENPPAETAPSGNEILPPLPANQQPPDVNQTPDVPQPPASTPQQHVVHRPPPTNENQQPAPANSNGGLLMPLPDNQQPPAAQQPQNGAPPQQ